MEKVICFIDGLNLYHSIDGLNFLLKKDMNYLKWLDLRAMCQKFIDPNTQELVEVNNFTAYATHIPEAYQRHKQYVAALNAMGVVTTLGNFKKKSVWANCCVDAEKRIERPTHEEKESDVNMALNILHKAYAEEYDMAIIISRDSDITPAVRRVKEIFPKKRFLSVSPPYAGHSHEMLQLVDKKSKLTISRMEKCLLPNQILDSSGKVLADRPLKYLTWEEKRKTKVFNTAFDGLKALSSK